MATPTHTITAKGDAEITELHVHLIPSLSGASSLKLDIKGRPEVVDNGTNGLDGLIVNGYKSPAEAPSTMMVLHIADFDGWTVSASPLRSGSGSWARPVGGTEVIDAGLDTTPFNEEDPPEPDWVEVTVLANKAGQAQREKKIYIKIQTRTSAPDV